MRQIQCRQEDGLLFGFIFIYFFALRQKRIKNFFITSCIVFLSFSPSSATRCSCSRFHHFCTLFLCGSFDEERALQSLPLSCCLLSFFDGFLIASFEGTERKKSLFFKFWVEWRWNFKNACLKWTKAMMKVWSSGLELFQKRQREPCCYSCYSCYCCCAIGCSMTTLCWNLKLFNQIVI